MANDRHSFGDRNHLCFYDFYAAKAVTGGGPNFSSSTIGLYVVSATETNQYNWAATVGVIFSIVGILLVMTIKHFVDKLGNDVEYKQVLKSEATDFQNMKKGDY